MEVRKWGEVREQSLVLVRDYVSRAAGPLDSLIGIIDLQNGRFLCSWQRKREAMRLCGLRLWYSAIGTLRLALETN